jgi:hypothetical protein
MLGRKPPRQRRGAFVDMAAPAGNDPPTARNDPALITKASIPFAAQGGKRDFHYMG